MVNQSSLLRVFLITLMFACNAFAQSFGPWPNPANLTGVYSPTVTDASAAVLLSDNSRNRNQTKPNLRSPKDWFDNNKVSVTEKYNGAFVLTHRGLVDFYRGMPENSLEAARNAVSKGLYLLEIDVQSSADNVALAAHDNTVNRVLGTSFQGYSNNKQRFLDYTAEQLRGKNILIVNPYSLWTSGERVRLGIPGTQPTWYTSNSTLKTVKELMDDAALAGATFFLDPKNLRAAEAVVKLAMSDENYAKRIVMKTYDEHWHLDLKVINRSSTISDVSRRLYEMCTSLGTSACLNLSKIRVMPVIAVRDSIQGCNKSIEVGNCKNQLIAVYNRALYWGRYFEVLSLELPGAWDDAWAKFATAVDKKIRYRLNANDGFLPKNIINGTFYSPVISSGYRFEDFGIRTTTGSVITNEAYVFEMDGRFKRETVNIKRRTACSMLPYLGKLAAGMMGSAFGTVKKLPFSTYITTDVPLAEVACAQDSYTGTISWGNPAQIFPITEGPSGSVDVQRTGFGGRNNPDLGMNNISRIFLMEM